MPDDIAHLIVDACIMTFCDCCKGYWHQELHKPSSFLTTFNTEFGHYRYTVMPFGATVAGDVFQFKLGQFLGQIPNVIVIADDIMVVGKMQNHRDHDQALKTLCHTARKCKVRLNYDKLQYKQTEVEIFGETYTVDGHKPVQSKVTAIDDMPPPTCMKQVQSFIGMVNYLYKFSVCLSELAEPIRELSKEKIPFNWGPEHQESFKLVKKETATAHILAYYIPRKATILQTDVSIKGLGNLLATRRKTCIFCKQGTDKSTKRLCGNQARGLCSGLGHGEILSLSLCQPLHP